MSAAVYMIPLPDGRWLGLSREEFATGIERGSAEGPNASPTQPKVVSDEAWLTSQELAAKTGVPDTWWEQAAKEGRVPVLRVGKYVRFKLSEVEGALRHADSRSATHVQAAERAAKNLGRSRRTTDAVEARS